MSDKEYNGWSNYETWCVNLWLSNDHGSYLYWNENAVDMWKNAQAGIHYPGETKAQNAKSNLADLLKDDHEDRTEGDNGCVQGASVFTDLLRSSLSEVNWHEIADHLLAERFEG